MRTWIYGSENRVRGRYEDACPRRAGKREESVKTQTRTFSTDSMGSQLRRVEEVSPKEAEVNPQIVPGTFLPAEHIRTVRVHIKKGMHRPRPTVFKPNTDRVGVRDDSPTCRPPLMVSRSLLPPVASVVKRRSEDLVASPGRVRLP